MPTLLDGLSPGLLLKTRLSMHRHCQQIRNKGLLLLALLALGRHRGCRPIGHDALCSAVRSRTTLALALDIGNLLVLWKGQY